MPIKRRETLRAEMKPDMYDGPDCDQMEPRWWTYGAGDKDGDFEHKPLTLDAKMLRHRASHAPNRARPNGETPK